MSVNTTNFTAHNYWPTPGRALEIILLATLFLSPQTTWLVSRTLMRWQDELLSLLAVAASGLWLLQTKGRAPIPIMMGLSLVLWLSSGLLHSATHGQMFHVVEVAAVAFSSIILPMIFAWATMHNPERRNRLLMAWVLGASVSALVAILSRHGMASLLGSLADAHAMTGQRAKGMAFHSNSFASISAFALMSALYLLVTAKHRWMILGMRACILLLAYGIYLSGSRTGLLAALIGLCVYAWFNAQRGFSRGHLYLLLSVIFTLIFITPKLHDSQALALDVNSSFSRVLGDRTTSNADAARDEALADSIEQFLDSPWLGVGYGAVDHAHNMLVQILHTGGLLAFIAFSTWLIGLFHYWFTINAQQLRKAAFDNERWLFICTTALLVMVAAATVARNDLADRNGYIMVGILLSLMMQNLNQQDASEHET